MTTRSGRPSLWRRLTDLGTDREVAGYGLPASCLTTADALAASAMTPRDLAQAMASAAERAGREQLTVAGGWHDPSHAIHALEELEQLWARGRRGVACQPGTSWTEARSVVRLVRGEAPRVSDRRSARRRRHLVLTLAPETRARLEALASASGCSVSEVVDSLVSADVRGAIAGGLVPMAERHTVRR